MTGGLCVLAASEASATLIGRSGELPTGIRRVSGYYSGNGGEFTIAGSGLDLSGYQSGAAGTSLTAGAFQTFCIERNEYTFGGAGRYFVNSKALNGGVNTQNGDDLSQAVAWLYCQFASQDWETGTPGYNYGVSGGRSGSAGLLQNAIWFLEEELSGQESNPYVVAATTRFGDLNTARQANQVAGFGVYVLNNFEGTKFRQDQLYYNPNGERVPDGGASLILFGLGLSGVSLIRRRLRS